MFDTLIQLRQNPIFIAISSEDEDYTVFDFVTDLIDASEYPTLDEPLQAIFSLPSSYSADLSEAISILKDA